MGSPEWGDPPSGEPRLAAGSLAASLPGGQRPSRTLNQAVSPEQMRALVTALWEDTKHEAALGDAAAQTRNIAVSEAAWTLGRMCRGNKQNTKLVVEAGGVEAVVFALKKRPNSEAVQSKATSLLGHLVATSPENQTLAGEAGGIEAVVSSLRGHPNSEAVQEHATQALWHLVASNHCANQVLARRAGGIEAVITALEQHLNNEALQRNASNALASLVMDNCENQLRASRAKGISALISSLDELSESELVQEYATEALGHLVANHRGNQMLAGEVGAIKAVIAVLNRRQKSLTIQAKALVALKELLVNNGENQDLAAKAGAMAPVVYALNGYPHCDNLQELACEALEHLVVNNEVNQRLAKEAGLIEAVIHIVLGRHPTNPAVQAKASSVLGDLVAGNPENQRLAGEARAIAFLTAGLKRHLDNAAVMEHTTGALGHLALHNRENQELSRKAGAIEMVIHVLRKPNISQAVFSKASSALRALIVGNHENTRVAVTLGAVEEVVSVLQQRPCREVMQKWASLNHEEYQKLGREAGLIEAVIGALKEHLNPPPPPLPKASKAKGRIEAPPPKQPPILPNWNLIYTLSGLVGDSYANQTLAGKAGAVDDVVNTLKCHPKSETVQEHGLLALANLMFENAANQRRGKNEDTEEVLRAAQEGHPECPPVLEAAKVALDTLCSGESFASRILATEYAKRHQTFTPIPDVAMRGITLEQILELHEFIQETLTKHDLVDVERGQRGRSVTWEDLTMHQVKEHFLLPLTLPNRSSFVEAVTPGRQPPMWMVSHWWGTPFAFTMRMLQLHACSRHRHGADTVTYWCDAFANNQHSPAELDEADVLKFPFARAMLSPGCMGTVLLVDPEVTLFLRTWCVFEAHITQQLRCGALADRTDKKRYFLDILAPVMPKDTAPGDATVTITMLQDAVGGSWNEVSDTDGVFFPLGVAHIGVGLDVRKAEASVATEQAAILNLLTRGVASKDPPPKAHPKYDEMNDFVHMVFASAELYRVASEQPAECVESAAALLELRADVNSFVRQGNTPLFAAAGADPAKCKIADTAAQRDLVELLLTARADVNHANADMKTVLDCATDLSEDARGLLLEHGAKTFQDAAPDLERSANAKLSHILVTGFSSEKQAFVGGDAGTKLGAVAQRSLQVAAAILKLYHWAPCRIGMQTATGRYQATLAGERAQNVRLTLESAGCTNSFEILCGAQKALLSLSVSLRPPSQRREHKAAGPPLLQLSGHGDARGERRPSGHTDALSSSGTQWHPRSPQAVLALRSSANGRLPPVGLLAGAPGAGGAPPDLAAVHGHVPKVNRPLPQGLDNSSPKNTASGRSQRGVLDDLELDLFGGNGWPHMAASSGQPQVGCSDGRPVTRNGLRQATNGTQRLAWNVADSTSSTSPQAASAGRGHHVHLSIPALGTGTFPVFTSGTSRTSSGSGSPKGLAYASPSGGGAKRTESSSGTPRPRRSQPPTPSGGSAPYRGPADLDTLAGDRWFQTSITCCRSTQNLHSVTGVPHLPASPGPVVSGAPLPLPQVSGGTKASGMRASPAELDLAPVPNSRQPPLQLGEHGRPPTRSGPRHAHHAGTRHAGVGPASGVVSAEVFQSNFASAGFLPPPQVGQPNEASQGVGELAVMRTAHSLPTLNPPNSMQRSSNRVFSVADLLD